MTQNALHTAQRFRRALEDTVLDSPLLTDFPKSSCTHASRFLSQYLFDNGLGDWCLVGGVSGASVFCGSHSWLVQGDTTLDITADQFDEALPSVWLTESEHPWYSRWRVTGSPYLSRMDHYGASDRTYLLDYARAVARADR